MTTGPYLAIIPSVYLVLQGLSCLSPTNRFAPGGLCCARGIPYTHRREIHDFAC